MYYRRTLERHLREASAHLPVLMVTGARQVGKTTFLRALADDDRAYVSLDDPLLLDLARREPGLLLQRFPGNVLIDEIQYAPGLLPYIKLEVDARRMPGRFWLTGSQQFHLMRDVSESLAGRVGIVRLLGLSRREQDQQGVDLPPFLPTPTDLAPRLADATTLPLPDLYARIWTGSYPALAADPGLDRDLFYNSYVQTYIQRDVRDLARVGDESAFLRFVRTCAARTAQLLNVAELARDTDIAPNTAKAWLSVLETSGLVHMLTPYHANVTKRLVKSPKLYFLDTGLCAWLTGWSSPATLEAGAASGAMLETWVIGELLRSWWHQGRAAPFHFYRDRSGAEVDLLIVQDDVIHPVEIKKTAAPGPDAARAFAALKGLDRPVGPGAVVCLAPTSLPISRDILSVPVGAI